MTAVPHELFAEFFASINATLPPPGEYAVGNIFFSSNTTICQNSQFTFEEIAKKQGLKVMAWRTVPRNSEILGPVSSSKEPVILQPFVVPIMHLVIHYLTLKEKFDREHFLRQLYLLRKQATHAITLKNSFYICSLTPETIIYKGQLSPQQVYTYFPDLTNPLYTSHFALVHSRFSTNTFPSWDRAQPMRWCAHNGEINTLQGNKNWMRAREGVMKSSQFERALESLYPIIEVGGSDSAAFDNVLELLMINGVVSLPEAVMMVYMFFNADDSRSLAKPI